ncbi:hypothetical protein [Pedobacter jejuensis]|uniref:Uncharacterized protein n=1 Tax=Pedobacter jejuensis TaxID=1268550 RepID=A0A3N0BYB8_9SPHI|nr:hypothetical protein [Pedobacter jejuensis]RNL54534.1 hypothetical protein D7004_07000 [Pedobacter jejuensis]
MKISLFFLGKHKVFLACKAGYESELKVFFMVWFLSFEAKLVYVAYDKWLFCQQQLILLVEME